MINTNKKFHKVSKESMNTMHEEEIEILRDLLFELDIPSNDEKIIPLFDKLLEHMQEHFESEEKLMQESHYPSFRMHQAEHAKVLREARYIEMQSRNAKESEVIRSYLKDELSPWLDQHIQAMDTPLSDYLVSMGL